jgi:Tfp pilus assembly protein FimT
MHLHVPRLRRSRGLTLVEICLVLALLVVIGGIAVPAMEGAFSRAALKGGADIVRSAWSKGRLAAMRSGQSYVFRCEPKAARFQLVALDQLGLPESESIQSDDPDAQHDAADLLRLRENRLPDGVIFADAQVSSSNQLTATLGSTGGGSWSSPILFRPDGTTSDASVLLVNASGMTIRVTLRGLTGISNASEVGKEAVP